MRTSVIAVFVFLAALTAAAKIESLDPSSFVMNSGEYFININGTELGDTVVFSGKAGEFRIDINAKTERGVIAWVPLEIIATPGRYVISAGGSAATFDVIGTGGGSGHPLVVLVPDPIAKPAESRSGAHVSFSVSAYGGDDPRPSVRCDHTSGDLFPFGPTIVKCEASNSLGQLATGEVFVTVYDATPPTLTLPKRIIVKAESREGTLVTFEATAFDAIDGQLLVTCHPKSGSLFPVGTTAVECSATDSSLNSAVGTFDIEVFDGEKGQLILRVPDEVVSEAQGPDGSLVEFEVTAFGTSDPNPTVKCDPKSGSLFPLGITTVKCLATDTLGNLAEGSFDVNVVDTAPPMIVSLVASPNVLPVSGKFASVTIKPETVDVVDPLPQCAVLGVTSNQPIEGGWVLLSNLDLELMAETDGTGDRVYTVYVHCDDKAGNTSVDLVNVTVTNSASLQSGVVAAPPSKRRAGGN